MQQTLVFDQALISRYDQSGPRYTSYPTAVQFHDGQWYSPYAGNDGSGFRVEAHKRLQVLGQAGPVDHSDFNRVSIV